MGKNQAYKAMQRARVGSSSAVPEQIEYGMNKRMLVDMLMEKLRTTFFGETYYDPEGFKHPFLLSEWLMVLMRSDNHMLERIRMEFKYHTDVDGSFHSPEWHAARLANLKISHTVTWEEFKRKQKDDEMKKGELEADTDRMMREYRAQLDAERACKLAQGRNHSSTKSKGGKDRKERDSKRCSSKRKRSHRDSISSNSSSDSWSSDEDEREQKRSKSKHRRRKDRKHRRKESGGDEEDGDGPVSLSRFFEDRISVLFCTR